MTMVKLTWDLGRPAWEALLAGCPDATFFHTPAWYAAVAAGTGARPDPALIELRDGTLALLPLAVTRTFRGLGSRAEAGVENGYGGIVAPRPLAPDEVEAAYAQARRRHPSLLAVGNPHGQGGCVPRGEDVCWDGTRALAVLDPEAQAAGLASMRLRHYKAARKAGFDLTVVVGPTAEDVPRFYGLYAAHAAQWAYTRWVRDEAYFRALLDAAAPALVLYLAHHEGRLAGFHLVAEHGRTALQLHLATDPAFNKQNPGTLLIMAALAQAWHQGREAFDFLPSGRLASVQAFKESFGARPLPFARAVTRGRWERTLGQAARLWAGRRPARPAPVPA